MKKTLTVNLGGTVFNIDDDAYRLLDNYLCNLKAHFSQEEGAEEIVDDIERRISELLAEKLANGQQVISIADVEEVIARVGRPEEMDGESGSAHSGAEGTEETGTGNNGTQGTGANRSTTGGAEESGTIRKRLYRNPDDKMLGGVISGMSAYLGWDVTLLRLLLLVILICGYGTLIPVYIVCWIIIPEAHTAAQKLSMRGEPVTVENIGKTVTDSFEKVTNGVSDYVNSEKSRNFLQRLGDSLVRIAGWIMKALLVVFVVLSAPFLLLLAIILVILIIATVAAAIGGGAALLSIFPDACHWAVISSPFPTLVMYIAAALIVMIPLFSLVWILWSQLSHCKPMNNGLKWTLLILWFVSLVCFSIGFINTGGKQPHLFGLEWVSEEGAPSFSLRSLLKGDEEFENDVREVKNRVKYVVREGLQESLHEVDEELRKAIRDGDEEAIEALRKVDARLRRALNDTTVFVADTLVKHK